MAVKKKKHRHHHREHYTGSLEERDTAQLSEMLAPPEEQPQKSGTKDDTIVVDASKVKLRKNFADADEEGTQILGFEPGLLVIVVLVVAFICFIAYLISLEPPKT